MTLWMSSICDTKPILSCFSTERKEAESASLSAKEERFGRLAEEDRRGGGVVVDTSDSLHPALHHRFLLFPSRQCKMPETESTWELLAFCWSRISGIRTPAEASPWPSDFCLMHLALTFLLLCIKEEKKKNREKFSTEKCVLWRFDTLVNESWRCKIASDLPLYDIEADLLWWDIIDSSVCNSICNRNKCALFFLNQFGEEFCWILINMVVKYSCSALLFLTTLHSNV